MRFRVWIAVMGHHFFGLSDKIFCAALKSSDHAISMCGNVIAGSAPYMCKLHKFLTDQRSYMCIKQYLKIKEFMARLLYFSALFLCTSSQMHPSVNTPVFPSFYSLF